MTGKKDDREDEASKDTVRQRQAPRDQAGQPNATQADTRDATPQSGAPTSPTESGVPGNQPRPSIQPSATSSPNTKDGKGADGPPQEAGRQRNFLEELLELLCRGPIPFNILGSALRRLPASWDRRVLAMVLVLLGIWTIRPVFRPVWSASVWAYYALVPGPPVDVNFINITRQPATIGGDFEYWTKPDDPSAKSKRLTMPDGALEVPAGGRLLVRLRLGRGPAIHRLYRRGSQLRLRFAVDTIDHTEAQGRWGKATSTPLSAIVYDPSQWSSPPIDVRFSLIGPCTGRGCYKQDHSEWAKEAIADQLQVFREVAIAPEGSQSNRKEEQRFITVAVGCYKTDESSKGEIHVKVGSGKSVEPNESDILPHTYDIVDEIEPVRRSLWYEAWRIADQIREWAWNAYPPQGKVDEVSPYENGNSGPITTVILDIGSYAGVFKGQVFTVWHPFDDTEPIGRVRIKEVDEACSYAEPITKGEIKEGCRVKRYVPCGS